MFYVLFPVIYTVFIKYISRTFDLDLLEFIAKFYFFTYLVFMALYGRNFSFSLEGVGLEDLGPYSGDGRTIHANSILMMIIPLLWYLHNYITKKKVIFLFIFIVCCVVILIHQHRSVWSSAIAAVLIYFSLTMRLNRKAVPKVWRFIFGAIIISIFAFVFISNMFPDITDFFAARFSEIFDPAQEESTGRFRFEQRETYFKLFLERPLFGWTFEGFEMDNPLVDWWPKYSGQHFHESYMEMLFYQGIVGFLVKFSFLFYLIYKAFSKRLTEQTVVILSFCLSGIIFSFSYVLPLIYWGHLGLCLYYIEKDESTEEEKENDKEQQKLSPTEQILIEG
jgi:O-antigen ligase